MDKEDVNIYIYTHTYMTIPNDTTHMWNLKYDMNISTEQKQTHRHREETCGCQGGRGEGEGRIGSLGLADANCYICNG